jgi:ribosomal protein S18 acetylase RimI-like enzyme
MALTTSRDGNQETADANQNSMPLKKTGTMTKRQLRKKAISERSVLNRILTERLKRVQYSDERCTEVRNVLTEFGAFCNIKRNGLNLSLKFFSRGINEKSDVPTEVSNFCFDLTQRNMKEMYIASDWGWNPLKKKREIEDGESRLLLVRDNDKGSFVGFMNFRFERMSEDIVLYVYEIQLEQEITRIGLGKQLMILVELIARKWEVDKITLTVLNCNEIAGKFYSYLGYDVEDDSDRLATYTILTKNIRKLILPKSETHAAVANVATSG